MPTPTNRYWFNPETNTFYGPNIFCHYDVIKDNIELSESVGIPIDINDENRTELLGAVQDILLSKNFVRIYFNSNINELGICCTKNKNALKTVRNFTKRFGVTLKSLFLDINDIGIQTGLYGQDIDIYIKYGRINPLQNI